MLWASSMPILQTILAPGYLNSPPRDAVILILRATVGSLRDWASSFRSKCSSSGAIKMVLTVPDTITGVPRYPECQKASLVSLMSRSSIEVNCSTGIGIGVGFSVGVFRSNNIGCCAGVSRSNTTGRGVGVCVGVVPPQAARMRSASVARMTCFKWEPPCQLAFARMRGGHAGLLGKAGIAWR